jgi:hypothetical protein
MVNERSLEIPFAVASVSIPFRFYSVSGLAITSIHRFLLEDLVRLSARVLEFTAFAPFQHALTRFRRSFLYTSRPINSPTCLFESKYLMTIESSRSEILCHFAIPQTLQKVKVV